MRIFFPVVFVFVRCFKGSLWLAFSLEFGAVDVAVQILALSILSELLVLFFSVLYIFFHIQGVCMCICVYRRCMHVLR